jgi:Ca2+-binding EF-hand superfamily protein
MAIRLNIPKTEHSYNDVILQLESLKGRKIEIERDFIVNDLLKIFNLKFEIDKEKNQFISLMKIFKKFDKNNDSKIDFYEFRDVILFSTQYAPNSKEKLLSDEYVHKIFSLMDINEDGVIDFKEFLFGIFIF